MKFRVPLAYAGLFVLAAAAGVLVSYLVFQQRHPPRPRTEALLLHAPQPLPEFTLADTKAQSFDRGRLLGHWSLLYFGYTHCPDACPTTLAALNGMLHDLGKTAAAPSVFFISVDPKRDNPALLRDYALYFNPAFTGVTGSLPALHALADPLGVLFSYDPPDQKGDYAVNHSSFVVLVDPQAEAVALFSPPLEPKRMAADYLAIVKYYGDRT